MEILREPDAFLQEMYSLFKVMHADIKRLCNEHQESRKEIIGLKSMVAYSNSGGGKKKKNMLDYDYSWLMPYFEMIKDQINKNVKYPTFQEYRSYSEQVLKQLQPEKMKELKQNKQWETVFQGAIIGVLKKVVRDSRSSIIASIKTRLFEIFSPNIQKLNTTGDSQAIYNWKRSQQTRNCLKKLRELYKDTDHTYQDEIIMRVWPAGFTSNDKDFAMAIATLFYTKIMMGCIVNHSILRKL